MIDLIPDDVEITPEDRIISWPFAPESVRNDFNESQQARTWWVEGGADSFLITKAFAWYRVKCQNDLSRNKTLKEFKKPTAWDDYVEQALTLIIPPFLGLVSVYELYLGKDVEFFVTLVGSLLSYQACAILRQNPRS